MSTSRKSPSPENPRNPERSENAGDLAAAVTIALDSANPETYRQAIWVTRLLHLRLCPWPGGARAAIAGSRKRSGPGSVCDLATERYAPGELPRWVQEHNLGNYMYLPERIGACEHLAREAHWLLADWRLGLERHAQTWGALKDCLGTACEWARAAFDAGASAEPPGCPLCLEGLSVEALLHEMLTQNAEVVWAAARLVPDTFRELQVIHRAAGESTEPEVLLDRIDAAEADWDRLVKAAALAAASSPGHGQTPGESAERVLPKQAKNGKPPRSRGGPSDSAPPGVSDGSPEEKKTPKTDRNLVYQSEAATEYNIPASTLSYAAHKSPGEQNYLWSDTEGRRRFYRRQDLKRLSRSRASLCSRAL